METLRVYLEYHAMLCAAGEMVDALPVAVSEWDDPTCPWPGWLARHLCFSDAAWLADRRTPVPFEPESWGVFEAVENWKDPRGPQLFSAGSGLDAVDGEWIVANGYVQVGDYERYGSTYVASALVNPDTSNSLMLALQAGKARQFRLPREGEEEPDDMEINESPFELHGWTRESGGDSQGLDEFDPLARGVSTNYARPGDDFLAQTNSQYLRHKGQCVVGEECVAWQEIWSLGDDSDRASSAYTRGDRLWVRRSTLVEYLTRRGMDLIMEVQISRNLTYRSRRGRDDDYDPAEHRIYLLRSDGTGQTVAGDLGPWCDHSP